MTLQGTDASLIRDELRALRAQVAAMSVTLERLTHKSLRPYDLADLACLLPVLREQFGGATWSAAEAMARVLNAEGLPGADARTVLQRYSAAQTGARSFGKFLARVAGTPWQGLELEVVDRSARDGCSYMVRSGAGFMPPETRPAAGADSSRS